ncbi:MAG: hypothetical protein AAB881_01510 [Patescibacteria group bacterium]
MSNYNFVKFESRNVKTEDRITVTKSQSIGLPTKFYTDNNIVGYKYAVLYYDKETNAIGINFTNDENEKNGFSIVKSEKYGGNIVSRSFFKAHNIDTEKYHNRYNWRIYEQENAGKLYVIELDNPKLINN